MRVLTSHEGAAAAGLHARLFGQFVLELAGHPVTCVDKPRMQALLAYLLLRRGAPVPRQQLAFALWPDSNEKQARTNLRHLLHKLRHAWPEADRFLRIENRALAWRPRARFTLDVAEFEDALGGAEQAIQQAHRAVAEAALRKAAELYQGDLLPDCYDSWIEPDRDRLRRQHLEALEQVIRLLEDRREYAAAIGYARRLQQQEPLRETAYATLMRLHALHGDRAAALGVYQQCVEVLQRELDVGPGPALQDFRARLAAMQVPLAEAAPPVASAPPDVLPLIGRGEAWERLRTSWRRAATGEAHFVVVSGEAGIGKTRLVAELFEWVRRQGDSAASTRSYAAEGRLAYAPVADWLRTKALRAALPRLSSVWLAEVSRLLPELGVQHPELPEPQPVRESWQRLRMFEAFSRAVLAGGTALLLVLDDLQWTDPETLAWLHYLLRFAPEARLLVAGTVRTEEADAEPALTALLADLRREGLLTELTLGPLGETETAELAVQLAARPLERAEAVRLHRETAGNPLFVVETVRAGLLEESVPAAALPARIQAVIAARLARLSPEAKALAGLAATVGQPFTFDLLAEASGHEERALGRALEELWQRRLVRELGSGVYDFSHDRLREVAYAQNGPVHRQLRHRQVARALETLHAHDLDAVSGRLAAHHEHAGQTAQAIPYYRRAGELAKGVHANQEAIRVFRKALALLEAQPDSARRREEELALRTALGTCLVAAKGHGAREVRHVYERALSLCEQLGRPRAAPILRGLAITSLMAGDLRRASALGEEILDQGRRQTQDALLLAEGHYVLGVASFWMGEFVLSRRHLEQAVERYDPQQHRAHITLFAQDPKVACLCRLGRTLWYLGYPDQAVRKVEDSLALARVLGHPFSRGYALFTAAQFYLELGDLRRARECVDALLPLAAEQGFSMFTAMGTVWLGVLLADQDGVEAGIAHIRQGITDYSASGGTIVLPQFYGLLARTYLQHGGIEDGLTALEAGMRVMEGTDERFYRAELLRLEGELLLAGGADAVEAESFFHASLEVARLQEARSLELAAAVSLGRFWQQRGEADSALRLLREVHAWFTEGFATPALSRVSRLLSTWAPAERR